MKRIYAALLALALLVAAFFLGRMSVGGGFRGGETTLKTSAPAPADPAGFKININTAGEGELCELPGVGPSTAKSIIEYRETHGPFETVGEIRAVRGIGEGLFSQIEKYLTVE